ncbi:hypothetical protein [Amycolatopsis sp. H20-H5]|uniref:hypothetical protein n=1 Tax=Amycolatopsis sp. H20-H5 TaxID=3046309 RepID=UPI002DBBEEFC|nr:hypothetical protein [Amycolatopsis sp. H20-H5]MEC3979523.1 hypothetical protein [Amycolatopsis sp. H20-H5]
MNEAESLNLISQVLQKSYAGHWVRSDLAGETIYCVQRDGKTITTLWVSERAERLFISVSCGLAYNIPHNIDVLVHLNEQIQEMYFGKLYSIAGQGNAHTVVTSMLIPAAPLSWANTASTDYAWLIINSMIAHGESLAPALVEKFGGQHFDFSDVHAHVLVMST